MKLCSMKLCSMKLCNCVVTKHATVGLLGLLFGNLEMQHTTELGVEECETTLHCYKY